ncbi:hypothetical protein GC170_11520 [bacterium]|nr:hypothetical protein [bacterium]
MHQNPQAGVNRRVLQKAAIAVPAGIVTSVLAQEQADQEIRDFLKPYVMDRKSVDDFLDPKARVWAKFDPDTGYLLRNSFMRDGVDGSHTLARYEPTGQRFQVNFRDRPCRINTYGNSFTQGHQSNDAETWQEILAGHFGEPIRNFGIGGFGVYQAALRLEKYEPTDLGAEYVIFNIWGDDHWRSINAWRQLTFPPNILSGKMYHSNPWRHARIDPNTGALVDKPNYADTPDKLRKLCEFETVYETFRNDMIVHALIAIRTGRIVNRASIDEMAAVAGVKDIDLSTLDRVKGSVQRLYEAYAIRAGMRIMERVQTKLTRAGKKLFVLLSYPGPNVWYACAGKPKDAKPPIHDFHPREFVEFLQDRKIPFIDTVNKHVEEFAQFRIDAKAYVERYYIGHYNPKGQHFFAFAIKNEIVQWLSPRPPTYADESESIIRFEGYLPG